MRPDMRAPDALRPVNITRSYLKHPDGSVLIETGDTKVICTATVEASVPRFLRGSGQGWITAEYDMIPGSTGIRKRRAATSGRVDGRSQEIKRLIGRALRSTVDLTQLGERTIWIDCDVIQADGGTRTASITGAFVALHDALSTMVTRGDIARMPHMTFLAATSVGIWREQPVLDLCYEEDANALVDMNVVMTEAGRFIELQGTGEERPFSRDEMDKMIAYAEKGIFELIALQKESLGIREAIVASGNAHKIREIEEILSHFSFHLKSMSEVGLGGLEIVEDGDTFEENSLIKARAVHARTGGTAIADDSGLMVTALDGAPGVYSARFSGEGATDERNNDHLLKLLEDVEEDNRSATFVSVVTVVFENGDVLQARGEVEGRILREPRGDAGFGYDPLFYLPERDKTYAELTAEEKNSMSHRGRALEKLQGQMEAYLKDHA